MTYSPTAPFSEYLQGEQLKYPELTLDSIENLKKSLAGDNLPPISDKNYLSFLHSCHFDVEYAKKTIQSYYGFHYDIPKLFSVFDPTDPEIEKQYKCMSVGQLPTVNSDKSDRFLFIKMIDYNASSFNFMAGYKYLAMWMEYTLLRYGTCDGTVVVFDSKGLNWRHVVILPVTVTQQMFSFLETALPIRLKAIHFLNTGSALHMIMKIALRFTSQETQQKIKMHSPGSEEIFNFVPRKVMPVELGGFGESHIHLNDELYQNITDIRDIFLERNEILKNHKMLMDQLLNEDDE